MVRMHARRRGAHEVGAQLGKVRQPTDAQVHRGPNVHGHVLVRARHGRGQAFRGELIRAAVGVRRELHGEDVRELVHPAEVVHLVDAAGAGGEGDVRVALGRGLHIVAIAVQEDVHRARVAHVQTLLQLAEVRDVGGHVRLQRRLRQVVRPHAHHQRARLDGARELLEHPAVEVRTTGVVGLRRRERLRRRRGRSLLRRRARRAGRQQGHEDRGCDALEQDEPSSGSEPLYRAP